MDLRLLRTRLEKILDECGKIISERPNVSKKISFSGQLEVVTDIDIIVEDKLKKRIYDYYPQTSIIAEESILDPSALDSEMCFVIDPIDGTKELVAGGSGFSISVALLIHRIPVFGILDFPARNQRFVAAKGEGAYFNGNRIEMNTKERASLKIAVSPTQYKDNRFGRYNEKIKNSTFKLIGALTPKIAAVIIGEVDAAFYLGWDDNYAAIWDYAAAGLILEEAGGSFTDLAGNRMLSGLPLLHRDGWIAYNNQSHSELYSLQF